MSQTQKYRYESTPTEQLRAALEQIEHLNARLGSADSAWKGLMDRVAQLQREIDYLKAMAGCPERKNEALEANMARKESQGGGIHGVLCEARFPEQELKVYVPDERAFHVIGQAVRERMGHVEFIVFRSGPKP